MSQAPGSSVDSAATSRASTGVPGLDEVLFGGLTPQRLYLVEGTPGTGKTTLALQFLIEGIRKGEPGLYVTLSETAEELRAVANSHGWSLDDLTLFELVNEAGLDPDSEQSILHPSEVELGETTRGVMNKVEEVRPARLVFDSLSEMRLLAQNPLRYRRQVLALKHFFANAKCTVLLLDDRTSEPGDLQLHSISHGVILLEQQPRDFGSERRRLRVVKMRGIKYRGGYHDILLDRGGITVFPQLVAGEHHGVVATDLRSTGIEELDLLLGGGLPPGTNTLLTGPSGIGKTTTAVRCMLEALRRGERATYYLFDEVADTLLTRSASLGMDLRPSIESGALTLLQIDPAELSPGQFSSWVRHAVEEQGCTVIVLDSLNGYLQAMPGDSHLLLQMHELLSYLNQQGITTLLVLGQHGLIGDVQADIDLSYLSDSIVLFRYFEAAGEVRSAVSVVKSRITAHERSIREFRLDGEGLQLGQSLTDFQGVLSGLPTYKGAVPMLRDRTGAGPA